jgi:hypothetical protein
MAEKRGFRLVNKPLKIAQPTGVCRDHLGEVAMENGFSFSFQDLQKGFYYVASFSVPNTLTLKQIKNDQSNEDTLDLVDVADNPWDIFCQHATFENILSGYDSDQDGWLMASSDWKSEKQFLENLTDHPDLLRDESAKEKLITIIKTAKDGLPEKRRQAKDNLHFYLTPIHPGGKRNLPPIKCIRYLLKRLATYLATKCINYLKSEDDYGGDLNLVLNDEWLEITYDAVQKWAAAQGEPRIAFMYPHEDLQLLITKPARFADQLIEKATGVSQRTLKRRSPP